MSYKNKTKEDLIELLEVQDDKIEELEQEVDETESLQEEVKELQNQINEFNFSLGNREEVSEKAFTAGYESGYEKQYLTKAWLNFKIGARL